MNFLVHLHTKILSSFTYVFYRLWYNYKVDLLIEHRWTFNLWMNTIKAFFQIIRAIFLIFQKGKGRPPPPLSSPLIVPLIRHQTYTCILKIIVSTSQKNFNNSIKIVAVDSWIATHVDIDKHHKNPQTILKNSKTTAPTTS